jgi:hypothetical protein
MEDAVSELSINDSQVEVDEAFAKCSNFPGTVKIVVKTTTFRCVSPSKSSSSFHSLMVGLFLRAHKEVLWFGSPFLQAALDVDRRRLDVRSPCPLSL